MIPETETVIEIKGLKVDYRGLARFSIHQMIKNPALRGGGVLHALRGIDLEIKKGEILGIVGENGAGKSTLLKAVAGIFQPDAGSIDTHGKRVSLMSLGVGFKWDLSGRDNIMLAGLLLRYPASYIKEKMQEIVDFSELGDAIDRPVRTYSSGMYSKLSFAITAVLETDVMLIDELLSVGDESFQAKSYRKVRELVSREGMTGIIVSHDMDLIRDICTRVVWLSEGKAQACGDPAEITDMYMRASAAKSARSLTVREPVLPEGGLTGLYEGLCVDPRTGLLEDAPEGTLCAVNWEPIKLRCGDTLSLKRDDVLYRTLFYEDRTAPELIYTKARSAEGVRSIYSPKKSELLLGDEKVFSVKEDGWYRFELHPKGGASSGPCPQALEEIFLTERREGDASDEERRAAVFGRAIAETSERAESKKRPGDAVLLLLADTHFSFGGTWEDTAYCVRKISERLRPDAAVHLGDLTDGTYPPGLLKDVAARIMSGLGPCCPAYLCAGNHDEGLGLSGNAVRRAADLPEKKLRLLFLGSWDAKNDAPYGFTKEDASWLEKSIVEMPEGFRAAVFSHIDPSCARASWDEPVRGGSLICNAVRNALLARPGCVYGAFCGHDHRDRLGTSEGFPIISIGSASLTDHIGTRPLFDGRYSRRQGEVSQELFDIAVLHADTGGIDLVRFGAGEDRRVGGK